MNHNRKPIFFCLLRLVLAMLAVAVSIISSVLWALEAWLRPLILIRLDEHWFLAAAIGGWIAATLAWTGNLRRTWHWRVGIAAVLGAACLIGVSIKTREVAMRMLMGMWDVHYAFCGDSPGPDVQEAMAKQFPERWFYLGMKPPVRERKGSYTSWTSYRPESTPFDHLLETSRWPLRRDFIQRVMSDKKGVVLATRDWHRLLPAIVGQDVTLSRRNELIDWLHAHSREKSAAPACRDAATFWMGLIVLTDVPQFEKWRLPVRDAMLACDDPPMSLTGDVWMRVLDALLAFDPDPTTLTQPLTRDGTLLRRAVRERVRGMEGHTSAIMREIETLDGVAPTAAVALWLDLKHLGEHLPELSKKEEIRMWLGERMLQWLTRDNSDFEARLIPPNRMLGKDIQELIVDFSDANKETLAQRASDLVNSTDPKIKSTTGKRHNPYQLPPTIIQALVIRNFLNDERRVALSRVIASFIASHLDTYEPWHSENPRSNKHAVSSLYQELSGLWADLDDDLRSALADRLQRSLLIGNVMRRGLSVSQGEASPPLPASLLAFFDSSLNRGKLNEAERLALLAETFGFNGGHMSYWTVKPSIEPIEFSSDGIAVFIQALAHALEIEDLHVSFRDPPGAIEFPVSWFGWFLRHFKGSELPKQDVIRLLLVHRRLIGPEHMPADWPRVFRDCPRARWLAGDHSDPEIWRPLMESSESAREVLELIRDQSNLILSGLFIYLMQNPPDHEIKEVIWNHYRKMISAASPEQRLTAWHVLMKTSVWMAHEERRETRRQFMKFFMRERPSLNDWSHAMMLDGHPAPYIMLIYPLGEDGHRGEWIDWEDDALSAKLSWSSQIHHECALLPHEWGITPNDGLFSHLVNASDVCDSTFGIHVHAVPLNEFHPSRKWRHPPPQLPFLPTPWQRARELHMKRPDLHFPDRPAFRPTYTPFVDS